VAHIPLRNTRWPWLASCHCSYVVSVRMRPEQTGVVDQNIDPSARAGHSIDHLADRRGFRKVGADNEVAGAGKASHNSLGAILAGGVVHRDPVTVLGESSGDRGCRLTHR
jgi:hypothetical protein